MRLDVEGGTGFCMWTKPIPRTGWAQTTSQHANPYHRSGQSNWWSSEMELDWTYNEAGEEYWKGYYVTARWTRNNMDENDWRQQANRRVAVMCNCQRSSNESEWWKEIVMVFASICEHRAVRLFLRARAVKKIILRTANTLENIDDE